MTAMAACSLMAQSSTERRSERRPRAVAEFGNSAEAVFDALELAELAWHDCFGDVTPPRRSDRRHLHCCPRQLDRVRPCRAIGSRGLQGPADGGPLGSTLTSALRGQVSLRGGLWLPLSPRSIGLHWSAGCASGASRGLRVVLMIRRSSVQARHAPPGLRMARPARGLTGPPPRLRWSLRCRQCERPLGNPSSGCGVPPLTAPLTTKEPWTPTAIPDAPSTCARVRG